VLRLTPAGEKTLAAARPVVERELAALTAAIPENDMKQVAATMATLRAALEAGAHGQAG
jgi:DNA-binding MarR family transcriptional regulator